MGHIVGFTLVPLTGVNGAAAQGLHRHGRDELLCSLGHDDLHSGACLDQRPAQFSGLVAGYSARKPQHNMFAFQVC